MQSRNCNWDIVWENRGLVHSIVKKRFKWILERSPVLDRDDLIQVGLMGLHHAVGKFDPSRGFALSTYSHAWICQYIRRCFHNEGFLAVRIPCCNWDQLAKLKKKHGKDFDYARLYNEGKISDRSFKSFLAMTNPVELDSFVTDESGETKGSLYLADPSQSIYDYVENKEMAETVDKLCEKLDDRESDILKKRYGVGNGEIQTLDTIGKTYNLTRERIRQIEVKAIKKLQGIMQENTVLI